MVQDNSNYDIIIVGLGPVGLLACNTLGKRGYQVLGIDRVENAYNFPRAIHFDDEILRILQSVNLAETIYPLLKPSWGLELLDTHGKVMFRGNNKFPGGYEASNFMFLQPELEQSLKGGARRFGNVVLKYGIEITDFAQSKDSVTVFSKDGKVAKARYLIASDGANSFFRNKLGIGQTDLKFKHSALKIDAYELKGKTEAFHAIQKICSGSKPYVRMQGAGKHRRWELNYNSGLSKAELEKPENIKSLLAEIGVDVTNLDIAHAVYYYFQSKLAKEWRRDNIFLAGDAAHVTPPYVGQGMCSGFRDVMNLTWKLDAVMQKKMPTSILDTYQSERYPHTKMQILKAIAVGFFFVRQGRHLLKLASHIPILNKLLLNTVIPADAYGKGLWGKGKASRYLFPQAKTQKNEFLDDFYQNDWAMVAVGKRLDSDVLHLCKKANLRALVFDDTNANIEDVKAWANKYNASYFIIRPDLYVYASGNNPTELCESFTSNQEDLWKSS
ncbi:MAG: bifunctional 3-(3-hydroxy-phenyl)propionate/3-hydroxycinnamic acid hydroxylase [Bacteroidetes bacterium]|nr:bifunctional 3-(3-hydroxy-phenyl)propionate/3-hydroxycinnamic acid hydroxylase [Bacteroidota bacterium]